MEPLIAFLLYLPLALLFAVALLEFAGAWQHSNRYDASSSLLLWLSAIALLPALAIAWFLKPAAAAGIPNPYANQVLTGIVVVLLLTGLGFKAYCRAQGIMPKPRKHRRAARLKGKALRQQMIPGTFRGILAVTCVVAAIAMVQSGSVFEAPAGPALADSGDAPPPMAPEEKSDEKGDEPKLAGNSPEPPKIEPEPPEPTPEPAPPVVAVDPGTDPPTPKPDEPEPPMVAKGDGTMDEPIEGSPFADVEPDMSGDDPSMTGDDPDMAGDDPMVADNGVKDPGASETMPVSNPDEKPAPAGGSTTPPASPFATTSDIYKKIIAPLFGNRCNDCHGDEKQKGGLRLDTPEWIRKGGDGGPVLIAGNPDKSFIYEVVSLPEDDPDIMPPKGKPLTDSQQRYIKQWILEGAPLNDGKQWPKPDGAVAGGGNFAEDKMADGMATPNAALIQKLNDEGVIVRPLSTNGAMLEVDFSHASRASGDMRIEELAPLAENIHTLDLKKTKISDDDLEVVEKMTNLRKINLALTDIGDNGLANVRDLEQLEYLNLYGTRVSDNSVSDLSKMKTLTKLFLWNSRVTESGYGKLKRALPKTDISFGL